MAHVHRWTVTSYVLLTLPDLDGFADRFTAWRCSTCGKADALAGCIRLGQPLETPEWWSAQMGVRTVPPQGRRQRRTETRRAGG
jgi:hypothetical protein